MRIVLVTAAMIMASTTVVSAQTNTPRIDARQANQQQRIDKGVTSGQLNAKEAARLQKGQTKVQSQKAAAKSDGIVIKSERAQIKATQNRQSARLAKQKHDAQKAN